MIIDKKERINFWKDYVTDLFEDNRSERPLKFNKPDRLPITVDTITKTTDSLN